MWRLKIMSRKTHEEFTEEVEHETSLPVEVGKYVNEDCQSKSDLSKTKNQIGDAVYTTNETEAKK